jgi:hypothetical protein
MPGASSFLLNASQAYGGGACSRFPLRDIYRQTEGRQVDVIHSKHYQAILVIS